MTRGGRPRPDTKQRKTDQLEELGANSFSRGHCTWNRFPGWVEMQYSTVTPIQGKGSYPFRSQQAYFCAIKLSLSLLSCDDEKTMTLWVLAFAANYSSWSDISTIRTCFQVNVKKCSHFVFYKTLGKQQIKKLRRELERGKWEKLRRELEHGKWEKAKAGNHTDSGS